MARTMFFCVSDDPVLVQKARDFGQAQGVTVQVFTVNQWAQGLNNPHFRGTISPDVPTLSGGLSGSFEGGAKVLPFPTPGMEPRGSVSTINELEAQAIEQAIHTFRGNLTEAAKALGIGRATLYRKVKQYNIDPANARRKKAA